MRRFVRTWIVASAAVAALLPFADPAAGQAERDGSGAAEPARTLAAVRTEGIIQVDGRLDDAAWGTAPVATGFVQRRPDPGSAASHRTEVRVLYDARAVYVGARLYDAPDSIVAQLARRDPSGIYSDWFQVSFDSYDDRRTAFAFAVNPRGVKRDLLVSDDSRSDLGWDAVWDVATRTDSAGWTVEFRIPLSQLRFSPQQVAWGVNFERLVARSEEQSFWSPTPPDAPGVVSQFGRLTGLVGLRSPGRTELRPYSVARLARAPGDAADPFYSENALSASVGLDVRHGISSDLTLTATINPDFGQVDADPSQVNLSAYETFFPERRPFFVEGADIFGFALGNGEQLFYSRRIGRAPRGGLPSGAGFHDFPEASTILGAAKVSGKTASGWSLGVLSAVTAREEARYLDATGTLRSRAVEPLANYAVARSRRDFNRGGSSIGAIVTSTHRWIEDDDLRFLPSAAYAAGLDGRHRFAGGNFEVSGWSLWSRVSGHEDALVRVQRAPGRYFHRPDASHLDFDATRTSLQGLDANLRVAKVGGGHWRGGLIGRARSPGFEINDLGYMRAPDRLEESAYVGYEEFRTRGGFRNWRVYLNQYAGWSWGGEPVLNGLNVNGGFDLTNFWSAYGSVERSFSTLSLDALRGGPALLAPSAINANVGMNTDPRKAVMGSLGAGMWREDETGGRAYSLDAGLRVRPSTRAQLSLSPSFSYADAAWQYVGRPAAGEYLFGGLERWTVALTGRINYTFTQDISLQFYAQPYITAGRYADFREVADPRTAAFAARLPLIPASELRRCTTGGGTFYGVRPSQPGCPAAEDGGFEYTFSDPDFNFKEFRSNLVLRWEYRPGSTAFLVWSQGRDQWLPDGSFSPMRDFGRLFGRDDRFRAPSTNVLLLKISYWFAP